MDFDDKEVGRRDLLAMLGTMGAAAVAGCGEGAPGAALCGPIPGDAGSVSLAETGPAWGALMYGTGAGAFLQAIAGTKAAPIAVVVGRTSPGDGGEGVFYWSNDMSSADDGGTIVVPMGMRHGCWKRVFSGTYNVRWFGARGDGKTNDQPAITQAIDAAIKASPGTVYFPPSSQPYRLDAAITLKGVYGLTFRGETIQGTVVNGSALQFTQGGFIVDGSQYIFWEHLWVTTAAAAGPAFDIISTSGELHWQGVYVANQNPSLPILRVGSSTAGAGLIGATLQRTQMSMPWDAGATVPAVDLYGVGGGLNNFTVDGCTITGSPRQVAPLVRIQATDNQTITNVAIERTVFEIPLSGAIHLYSVQRSRIVNCWAGDLASQGSALAPQDSLIKIDKAAIAGGVGLPSSQILIESLQTDVGTPDKPTIYATNVNGSGDVLIVNSRAPYIQTDGNPVLTINTWYNGAKGYVSGFNYSALALTTPALICPNLPRTLQNGDNNDVDVGLFSTIDFSGPTSAFAITGLAPAIASDGRILEIYNLTSQSMTLAHRRSSQPANQIHCLTNADIVLPPRTSYARLRYHGDMKKWLAVLAT